MVQASSEHTPAIADERTKLLHDDGHGEQESSHTDAPPTSPAVIPVPAPTPLPWKPLVVIFLITMMQPLGYDIVFPFVNQMILEIGVVADPERVGFYSGFIESIFSVMSFITVLPAGYLSDRLGRKPVVLVGTVGLAISTASFGMSKSLLAMILTRCIAGGLGGVWSATKMMIAELTDKTNQGQTFQWWLVAGRIGQITGFCLGGLLAHPERNFALFRSEFWFAYPFALPCFVASAFAICAAATGYITLQETLKSKKRSREGYGSTADESPNQTSPASPSFKSILTPPIISLLLSNIAMCLAAESLSSLFPLFSFTPVSLGGLGLNEATIGTQLASRSSLCIAVMPFYSTLEKYFGSTVRLYRVGMWLWPISILCLPILNLLARTIGSASLVFNITLWFFFVVWATGGYAWVSISVMVTDAAPSAGALSTVNSLSQMAIILPQAIAPAFVTSLFAFSINSGIAGGQLIWIVLFIFTSCAAAHSMTLREPTTDWRKDDQMD